ncbi:MAG: type II toxin-antitoxin system HicA family toxin [Ignavibacteria bacterium]|nr:type II toxin-antitoxin system HicA family toxin [Ignavibacteria bacterium]
MHHLNFDGPFSGAKHQFMVYNKYRLTIPSNDEYSVPQLRIMIREIEVIIGREITIEEWYKL